MGARLPTLKIEKVPSCTASCGTSEVGLAARVLRTHQFLCDFWHLAQNSWPLSLEQLQIYSKLVSFWFEPSILRIHESRSSRKFSTPNLVVGRHVALLSQFEAHLKSVTKRTTEVILWKYCSKCYCGIGLRPPILLHQCITVYFEDHFHHTSIYLAFSTIINHWDPTRVSSSSYMDFWKTKNLSASRKILRSLKRSPKPKGVVSFGFQPQSTAGCLSPAA